MAATMVEEDMIMMPSNMLSVTSCRETTFPTMVVATGAFLPQKQVVAGVARKESGAEQFVTTNLQGPQSHFRWQNTPPSNCDNSCTFPRQRVAISSHLTRNFNTAGRMTSNVLTVVFPDPPIDSKQSANQEECETLRVRQRDTGTAR